MESFRPINARSARPASSAGRTFIRISAPGRRSRRDAASGGGDVGQLDDAEDDAGLGVLDPRDRLGARARVDLPERGGEVRLDGALRQVELVGDLAVRRPRRPRAGGSPSRGATAAAARSTRPRSPGTVSWPASIARAVGTSARVEHRLEHDARGAGQQRAPRARRARVSPGSTASRAAPGVSVGAGADGARRARRRCRAPTTTRRSGARRAVGRARTRRAASSSRRVARGTSAGTVRARSRSSTRSLMLAPTRRRAGRLAGGHDDLPAGTATRRNTRVDAAGGHHAADQRAEVARVGREPDRQRAEVGDRGDRGHGAEHDDGRRARVREQRVRRPRGRRRARRSRSRAADMSSQMNRSTRSGAARAAAPGTRRR